jgi:N-methylhydantoinase A
MLSGSALTAERIAAEVAAMLAQTGAGLEEEAEARVTYQLRYSGQAFELPVPGPVDPDPAELVAAFERAHEERYGHRDPEGEVVLVDIDLALVVPGPTPRPIAAAEGALQRTSRRIFFEGEWIETPVLRGEPPTGTEAEGPVVFELPEATLVLPPGWTAAVDDHGTIVARFQTHDIGAKGTTG